MSACPREACEWGSLRSWDCPCNWLPCVIPCGLHCISCYPSRLCSLACSMACFRSSIDWDVPFAASERRSAVYNANPLPTLSREIAERESPLLGACTVHTLVNR